jgi:hypothetical protein
MDFSQPVIVTARVNKLLGPILANNGDWEWDIL